MDRATALRLLDAAKIRKGLVKQFGARLLHPTASRASASINRRVEQIVKLTGLSTQQVWDGLLRDVRAHEEHRKSLTVHISELAPRK